jgi:ankyrin repeat protein
MGKLETLLQQYRRDFWFDTPNLTIWTRSPAGTLPIHRASMVGSPEEIATLLEAGSDINAKGEDDFTPLHCAVEFDRPENVKLLLLHGASPTVRNRDGHTPRDLADLLDHKNCLEILTATSKGKGSGPQGD